MKVAVCMATYNGEKYLSEQIDSILAQTYHDFDLLISDDFSKDGTCKIIEQYNDGRVKLINQNNVNIGYRENFKLLMNAAKNYDLIFFADQDDVWERNKIKDFISYIQDKKIECYKCQMLLYSNYKTISSNGKETGIAYMNPNHSAADFHGLFVQNEILGCTMAITHALLVHSIDIPKASTSHDDWIALIASLDGTITYFDKCYTLHRIHDQNATTRTSTTSTSERVKRVIQRYRTNDGFIRQRKEIYHELGKVVKNRDELDDARIILFSNRFSAFSKTISLGFKGVNRLQTVLFAFQILLK